MKIHMMEQRTEEWFSVKCGKISASLFSDLMMAKSTDGYNDLISKIAYERLTGKTCDTYLNKWMDRGTKLEPEALAFFELNEFTIIDRVGFVELDDFTGCSPDGMIGKDGLIQAKCPILKTQVKRIEQLADEAIDNLSIVPKDVMTQMQAEMYVTGRKWNIFWSWHPGIKPVQIKVERNETTIQQFKTELKIARKAVKARMETIRL